MRTDPVYSIPFLVCACVCTHACFVIGIWIGLRLLQLLQLLLMRQLPSSMTIGILCPAAIGDGMPTGCDRSIGRGRLSLRRCRHESLLINSETNGFTGESLGRTKEQRDRRYMQGRHARWVNDCMHERKNGTKNGCRWSFAVNGE